MNASKTSIQLVLEQEAMRAGPPTVKQTEG
jgi:hypothetical protein